MRLNKISLAAFVLGGSMLLSACGGGNDSPLRPISKVTTSTTASINPASGPAVVSSVLNQAFNFDAGVPLFGTSTPTTLALSGTGAAPSVSLTADGKTATGTMTFGSCIFTITGGSFVAPHPLAPGGAPITVSPCTISIDTAGSTANGTSTPTDVSFVLGTTVSNPVPLSVSISSTGVVTVGGVSVGTATVIVTTGAGT